MKPELLAKPELLVIGIETRTTNRDEMAPATAKIPALWGRFFQAGIRERIPNRKPEGFTIGAYTKYEGDHTGPYTLLVGPEVTSIESIPSGMTSLIIPAGEFLVFSAHGPMPKALIDTWTSIWNYFLDGAKHKRLYTTDYEVHRSADRVDVHVAVR
jgi:predicted transcriptional regulator YdeE